MTLTQEEKQVLKDYLSLFMIELEKRLSNGEFDSLSDNNINQFDIDIKLLTDIYKRL